MTIGIVFYSRTGNTRTAAQLLAEKLKQKKAAVDLIEIEAVKRPGFFTAGHAAMKQKDLPIKNTDFNLAKYDLVIVGSPVWASSPSPFIRTFFSSAKNIEGKDTALFITGGGMPNPQGKPRQMIQQLLADVGMKTNGSFLGLQMRRGTIKDGEQDIERFVQSILE